MNILFLSIIINLISVGIILTLAILTYLKYRSQIYRQAQFDSKTRHISQDMQNQTEEALGKALREELKVMEDFAQKSREKQNQLLEASSKLLDEGIKEDIAQIRDHIKNRFDKYFSQTQAEIGRYKQDQFKSIDENANKLLREVIKKALPEVIPSEDHTQIVLDSLEKAKKEGLNL